MKVLSGFRAGLLAIVALCGVPALSPAQGFNFGGGFQGGFDNFGTGGAFQAGFNNFGGGFQGGGGFNNFGGGFQGGGGFNNFGGGGGGFQGGFNGGGGQGGFQQFGGQTGPAFDAGGTQGTPAPAPNGFEGGATQPFASAPQAQAFPAANAAGEPGFVVVVADAQNVLAIDAAAIASCVVSGVPVALSQRELLLHSVRAATQDVNARLFRLRASAGREAPPPPAAAPPSAKGKVPVQPQPLEVTSADGLITIFAGGGFAYGEEEWRGLASGFDAETWTGTVGLEVRLADSLTLGLAATYLETDGDFASRGSVDLEGYALSAYLSWVRGGLHADVLYSYGSFEEDISRVTGLGTLATGDPESGNHSVEFNTGYNFQWGRLLTGPIIGLDYRNGELDGYEERGAGRADLVYEAQKYDSLVTRLGWQASARFETGFGAITPQVRAAWERENLNRNEYVGVSLRESPYEWIRGGQGTPGYGVRARSARPDEDYLSLGAGLLFEFGDKVTLTLNYTGHLLRSDAEEHFASVVLEVKF